VLSQNPPLFFCRGVLVKIRREIVVGDIRARTVTGKTARVSCSLWGRFQGDMIRGCTV